MKKLRVDQGYGNPQQYAFWHKKELGEIKFCERKRVQAHVKLNVHNLETSPPTKCKESQSSQSSVVCGFLACEKQHTATPWSGVWSTFAYAF